MWVLGIQVQEQEFRSLGFGPVWSWAFEVDMLEGTPVIPRSHLHLAGTMLFIRKETIEETPGMAERFVGEPWKVY